MPETEISDATLYFLERFADRHDLSVVDALRLCILFAHQLQDVGAIRIQQSEGRICYQIEPVPSGSIRGTI